VPLPLGSTFFTFSQSQKKKKTLQPLPIQCFLFQFAKVAMRKTCFFPKYFSKKNFLQNFTTQKKTNNNNNNNNNHHFDSNPFRVGFMLLTLLSSTAHRLCIGTCVIQIVLRVCCLMLVILIWF